MTMSNGIILASAESNFRLFVALRNHKEEGWIECDLSPYAHYFETNQIELSAEQLFQTCAVPNDGQRVMWPTHQMELSTILQHAVEV